MRTNLGRTQTIFCQNKSGGSLNYGDLVFVDTTNDLAVITTTTVDYALMSPGVVLEKVGIADDAYGLIATSGFIPQLNLSASGNPGEFFSSHSVAGQASPHAGLRVGDLGVILSTGSTPQALLWEFPNQIKGHGTYFQPIGLTGATQTSRYVGATVSGAPITGTFSVGDFVIDHSGTIWICTVAGSPGTWVNPGGGGGGRTLIEEKTPSGVGSVQWTSIPSTYRKLVLEGAIRSTQASDNVDGRIRFNGDTTDGNYRQEGWRTNQFGTSNDTGATARFATQSIPGANATANGFAQVKIEIIQYANTAFTKRAFYSIATVDNAFYQSARGMVHWSNTAAINQIDIVLSAGNFVANSVLRLYGEM